MQSTLIASTSLDSWPGFNVLWIHSIAWTMVTAPLWLVQMILCLQNSPTFSFPMQDRIRKFRGKAIKANELPSTPFKVGKQRKYTQQSLFPQTHLLSQLWLVILQNINVSLIQLPCMLFTYFKWNWTPFRFNFETRPNPPQFKCPLTKFNVILTVPWGSSTSQEFPGFCRLCSDILYPNKLA